MDSDGSECSSKYFQFIKVLRVVTVCYRVWSSAYGIGRELVGYLRPLGIDCGWNSKLSASRAMSVLQI